MNIKKHEKRIKNNNDHLIEKTMVRLSPFMKRYYREQSKSAGGNSNNQISLAHGIQAVALRERKKQGIKTEELYPKLNH